MTQVLPNTSEENDNYMITPYNDWSFRKLLCKIVSWNFFRINDD